MDISVAVIARNEERNIVDCLYSILGQDYAGTWEVIVIDGSSSDYTPHLVKSMGVRIVDNPQRTIARGRNVALWASRYQYIAFTDADCRVPPDWLTLLSVHFKGVGVGGANQPPDTNNFYRALRIYLDSWLGGLNSAQCRDFGYPREVNSLSCTNVLYKKSVLMEIDGFDEQLGNVGEDLDIGIRLRSKGHSLYFIPNVSVVHRLRPDLPSWLRNMALYGKGRAVITHKHRLYSSPFFLLPMLFIVGLLVCPIAYLICITLYVLKLTWNFSPAMFFKTLIIFITTHIVYACNLLYEFLNGKGR